MLYIKLGTLFILLIIAAIIDVKTKKIPNNIFVAGLITAFIFDTILFPVGIKMMIVKFIGLIIIFFIGSLRLIGLGDIKLWMVISAYLGLIKSSIIISFASIFLVILSILENKENIKLAFLTISQLVNNQEVKIIEQKAYPLAPYILISYIFMCIYIVV